MKGTSPGLRTGTSICPLQVEQAPLVLIIQFVPHCSCFRCPVKDRKTWREERRKDGGGASARGGKGSVAGGCRNTAARVVNGRRDQQCTFCFPFKKEKRIQSRKLHYWIFDPEMNRSHRVRTPERYGPLLSPAKVQQQYWSTWLAENRSASFFHLHYVLRLNNHRKEKKQSNVLPPREKKVSDLV
jgi:hypothetical protein